MSLRAELLSLLQEDEEFRQQVAEILLPEFSLSTRVTGWFGYGNDNRSLDFELSAGEKKIADSVSLYDLRYQE